MRSPFQIVLLEHRVEGACSIVVAFRVSASESDPAEERSDLRINCEFLLNYFNLLIRIIEGLHFTTDKSEELFCQRGQLLPGGYFQTLLMVATRSWCGALTPTSIQQCM